MKQHNKKTATVLMGLLAMGSAQGATIDTILNQDAREVVNNQDTHQTDINTEKTDAIATNDEKNQDIQDILTQQNNTLAQFNRPALNQTFRINNTHQVAQLAHQNLEKLAEVTKENADNIANTNANLAKLAIKNAEATVKAEDAQETADEAQTTANNAQTTAQNAENKATQAEQLAQNANNQIAGLQNVANNAQDTADTALSETRRLERNKANRTEVIALQDEVRSWEKVVIQHDNQIQVLNQQVSTHSKQIERLNQRIEDLSKETQDGLAAQAALTGLFQPYNVGKLNVSAALGGYKSRTAIAVGVGYRVNERVAIKAGLASNTRSGDLAYNIGVNVEF